MKKMVSCLSMLFILLSSVNAPAYTPLEDATLCGNIYINKDSSGNKWYELHLPRLYTPMTEGYNTEEFAFASIFLGIAGSPVEKQIAGLNISSADDICVSGQLIHDSDDTSIDFNPRKPLYMRKQTAYPDPETSGEITGDFSSIFIQEHICFIEIWPDRGHKHYFEISYGDRVKFAEYLGEFVKVRYKLGELQDISIAE